MQGYNCIMVYSHDHNRLLFCKRTKDPYKGLFNLVGGKIEKNENGYEAAYRELREETGIDDSQIELSHMMDFTYYNQDCYVEVYVGYLKHEVSLVEEAHPLYWLDINEDFFNQNRFAGEGNIGHMVEQVKQFGVGIQASLENNSLCIGVDGCKGGWIAAILNHGELSIQKYSSVAEIADENKDFQEFLIDMVIGLPSNENHIRPDGFARQIIKERTSTIFPVPCRQAVYASSIADAYDENVKVLGKRFTPLTVGIMPKMKELDTFLQINKQYKNRIKESHPEVCFARLNGKTVLSKKSQIDGIQERIEILTQYLPNLELSKLSDLAKEYRCNMDDIIDAVCLAVTANLVGQGEYEIIPEQPMKDETGLLMQMVIPKQRK